MADVFTSRAALVFYILATLGLVFIITAFTIQREENLGTIRAREAEIKSLKEKLAKVEQAQAACSASVTDCSATLQACIGSCVESELQEVVQEAIRIKR